MYVVTFYSFKGGVGRTMALVNSAFELARKGKKVLIVDFDLEAPGISTYEQFSDAADAEGMVDYVVSYKETGEAPDVMRHIVRCSSADGSASLPLYVMPAGKRGRGYSTKFYSIDWQRLYSDYEGYLMFEDMKQQWRQAKFDYVLIDSRTGHTDIGGICTRHLPDAVVLMFFPNKQNIDGLGVVVEEIRQQQAQINSTRQQNTKPKLLFCPSNVPVLDDEENILGRQMTYASNVLGYTEPAATISHYESLDLVNQAVFVIHRRKTRLAGEYQKLVGTIVKGNLEDKEGALATIEEGIARLRMRRPRYAPASEPLLSDIEKIERIHPNDGEIAFRLASIYRFLGNLSSEHAALTIAIEQRHEVIEALRLRAANLYNQGQLRTALDDLRAVLNSDEAGPYEVSATFEPLRRIDPSNWVEVVAGSTAIGSLRAEDLLPIADQLTVDEKGSFLAAELIRSRWSNSDNLGSSRQTLESVYVLSLIGSGQFAAAKKVLTDSHGGQGFAEWDDVADAFNYAMAEWGEKQTPPVDALRRVLAIDASKKTRPGGANYPQCMALVHAALGNRQGCEDELRTARNAIGPGTVFSSWRYLKVSRYEMMKDLEAIERGCQFGKPPQPPFLKRRHELLSVE